VTSDNIFLVILMNTWVWIFEFVAMYSCARIYEHVIISSKQCVPQIYTVRLYNYVLDIWTYTIAEAVSRWLPTAAARVRVLIWQVGFVVDKVASGQVYSEYFGFPCQNRSFHQLFHPHNHPGQTRRGLATSWSPLQRVLLTVLDLITEMKRKVSWRRPRPKIGL
jgi:CDP-diglyceride synthetase